MPPLSCSQGGLPGGRSGQAHRTTARQPTRGRAGPRPGGRAGPQDHLTPRGRPRPGPGADLWAALTITGGCLAPWASGVPHPTRTSCRTESAGDGAELFTPCGRHRDDLWLVEVSLSMILLGLYALSLYAVSWATSLVRRELGDLV